RPHLAANGTAVAIEHGPDNHLEKIRAVVFAESPAAKMHPAAAYKPTFHTFISIFERFFNVFFLDKADILICSRPRQSKGIRPHSQCR
ncbi:MAG: hypothetical protein WAK57_11160, partial [Desulfobacterales bacterium]